MIDLFSAVQLSRLRSEFSRINTIDPCGPTYPQIVALLDGMSLAQLRQVRDANIKFMSKLAINRIIRKEFSR